MNGEARLTRRAVLGLSVGALGAIVSACRPKRSPRRAATPDPDATTRAAAYEAEVAVLAAYDAAMRSAGPTAQALIAPLRDDHQRHLATLGRGSSRALVISPTSSRDLAEAERTSATSLASAAASAPDGAIAALLASIAASHRAHHAHLSAEPFRW